ncbi:hypothetical protein GWN42_18360 [candidate division KSB1 bacterium]|nr:hypothetical protein [candidate division KSB1 bacterium]
MGIDQAPILIAGPPRSGTIMTAGLLFHHGVWIGRARTTWFPGTNPDLGVENQDIKAIMKREAAKVEYRNWRTPLPERIMTEGVKEEIESFVPEDVPWLVKTSWTLAFNHFWLLAYPDAKWILTLRPDYAIFDSMNRHPRMRKRPADMKKQFIKALKFRQQRVLQVARYSLGIRVKKIANRDEAEIQKLFDFVGIEPNWAKISEWIEPGRMK